MSLLPPSLSLLLALLWEASPIPAEASQALWYRGLVSQAQLDAATTYVSFQVSDEILCSALASKAAWCHLLTYDGATCALYDVVMDSLDAAPDATTPCMTRHSNGGTPAPAAHPPTTQPITCQASQSLSPQKCVHSMSGWHSSLYSSVSLAAVCFVDGVPVPHWTKVEQECFTALCWNRVVGPGGDGGTAVTTCDGDFVQDALGCVYLHKVPWSRLQISKIYELSWTRTRRARVSS
ncbi:uncharacterized protein LOC123519605 isoform X2 [Portunus trituberculatus]|uniref:uncharacterized protein LOC123519605 isoform X2 n=1 Tax=Portunus trituberculatus TaxID=210409 RepID=UPI001E1CB12C|nr:uncharacterized protein LOC123519605 isoform X2 [Portunus trituberculatus]